LSTSGESTKKGRIKRKITLNKAVKHKKLAIKAVKEVTLNRAVKHEKCLIKAIQESSGLGQREPRRDNRPFLPSFVSCCK
jgi:hypothetical protein